MYGGNKRQCHLPLDKMTAISQMAMLKAFFMNEKNLYFESTFTEICS